MEVTDKQLKQLREVQLNLLQVFIDVCNQLNIPYYCVCGTALGAVKYGGYIPWDDDLDVGLLRPDYELFCKKCTQLLPKDIFLQNYHTDPQFPHIFSKLRDSRTTQLEQGVRHLNMNHGIYIDIFPIDGHPKSKAERVLLKYRKKLFSWKQCCALRGDPKRRVRIRNQIFRIMGYHKRTAKTLEKMERMLTKHPPAMSEIWCNYGNWQGEKEYAHCSQYGKGTSAVFEGIDVTVPENYDAYLTQKYGNWREDPPKDKQVSHHSIVVLDSCHPYTDYV